MKKQTQVSAFKNKQLDGVSIFFVEYVNRFKHLLSDDFITKEQFVPLVKKDKLYSKENKAFFLKTCEHSNFKKIGVKDNYVYWNY